MTKRSPTVESPADGSKLTLFLLLLVFVAFALGFTGFMELSEDTGLLAIHSSALRTIQLFILNLGPADLANWQTRVASVIAPLTTIGATISAFSGRLQLWRQWASLRTSPAQDLYLGAGRTAAAIATSGRMATAKARRQVGVDLNNSTIFAEEVNGDQGCFVLQGDATSSAMLRKINAGSAARVWIVAGDDERNISILRSLILAEGVYKSGANDDDGESANSTRRWFVDISNRETARIASTLFKDPKNVIIEYFNFERIAARRLMQKFALETLPSLCTGPSLPPKLHICVVGSGELAEAIVLQSIQQLVVSENPEECLRLTWIAPDASESMGKLTKRIPALGLGRTDEHVFGGLLPLAITNCLDLDVRNISPHEWSSAQGECSFSTVYIASPDELHSVGAMFRIAALRDIAAGDQREVPPVVLCHWSKSPSWTIELKLRGIVNFHVVNEIFRPGESYPGEHMDELAKMTNASYSLDPGDGRPKDSWVEAKWRKLAEPLKWSSRMSADHASVKDALISCSNGNLKQVRRTVGLTQDEVESNLIALAKLEHRRFLVERLIEGWLPLKPSDHQSEADSASGLSYGEQKRLLRLNHTLVPYSQLPEEEQAKILPSIRALPTLIAWTVPNHLH